MRCGTEIVSRGAWHQVVGFEQDRSAGGTNALALRKRTEKVACNACVSLAKSERERGVNPNQGSLA